MKHLRLVLLGLLALAALLNLVADSGPAHAAATFIVTKTADTNDGVCDADCSLREAIAVASPGDTIDFSVTGTITLALGELTINQALTINGPGAANLTISGNNVIFRRVFNIMSGTVEISGLTIQNGAGALGGGIRNDGTLTLTGSTVRDNSVGRGILNGFRGTLILNSSTVSGNSAGGISNSGGTLILNNSTVRDNSARNGSGIFNATGSTLTMTNSTVSGNTADSFGGGILNVGTLTLDGSTVSGNSADSGGGIDNAGEFTLNSSTVSGNRAIEGGGIRIANVGTLTLDSSTVSGNTALFGGGILNVGTLTLDSSTVSGNTADIGGGIHNFGGTLTLNSSTVSGNTAAAGGGLFNEGTVTLNNSTVSGNTANFDGGGILNNGSATLKNTIVANSTAGSDCSGTTAVTSAGYNLDSDGSCGLAAAGDISNTDPLVGPLADNGGPTQTHALLAGSPAIDAGSPDCPPPATDQRGVARPQGAACDIGAYEFQDSDNDDVAPTPTPTPTPSPTPTPGVLEALQLPETGGEPGGAVDSTDAGWLATWVAVLTVGVLTLAVGGWYARRRRLR